VKALRDAARRGLVRGHKVGRKWMFNRAEVDRQILGRG
jgi:hypothetical protein